MVIECKACRGEGILADDEGWQYKCSVCDGTGEVQREAMEARVMDVDENNRLLD